MRTLTRTYFERAVVMCGLIGCESRGFESQDAGAGTDARDGVGADADTSSFPDAGVNCRTYATAYSFSSSSGVNFSETCSHSESGGFERRCQATGVINTDTERWASRSDFIDEAAAIGISKMLSFTRSNPMSQVVFEYDGQERLLRTRIDGALWGTYDAWDNLGRPLHALLSYGVCAGYTMSLSYGNGTFTFETLGGPCAQHVVISFDADGIRTGVDYGGGTTATYTTTSRATVCR